jgi:dihydroceramide fatty acyl 2-hydroxylase
VGALGPAYDCWTHQALPGIPRLFGPDWMEACSKTPWWLIPLIWVPLSMACMVVSGQNFGLSLVSIAWRTIMGVALWHMIEYTLHRFAFHLVPTSRVGVTFHFLLHGIHHKYPNDPLRLVMPLIPAIILTGFLVSVFKMVLPWSEMFPIASGVILGYVQYDCTHYFIHHGVFKGHPWFEALRESHMDHHYRNHTKGYGITTSFFDFVCRSSNHTQCAWTKGWLTPGDEVCWVRATAE